MAERIVKYEFAGSGCLVQGFGLIALFFWPIGTFIGLALLVAGSVMSKRILCGNCKNKIESKDVAICPVCKEKLFG